jgi:hypothetical protein
MSHLPADRCPWPWYVRFGAEQRAFARHERTRSRDSSSLGEARRAPGGPSDEQVGSSTDALIMIVNLGRTVGMLRVTLTA